MIAASRSRHGRMMGAAAAAILLAGLVVAVHPARAAQSPAAAPARHLPKPSASDPAVSGPVTGGNGAIVLASTAFPLSQVGYEQSEFFLSGKASAYEPVKPLTTDGKWSVTAIPGANKSYTTRAVVYRPADPRRFNGTVLVEWLNVSGGLDDAPDWTFAHDEMIRDGFAWVGISAQALGVTATKNADPVRYAALNHPGDSYSYDIFSQAGQAVWDNSAQLLGGLKPSHVVAIGESQSAFRLTTYIDAVQPLVNVFDGFLVHSRGAGSSALSQAPEISAPTATPPVVLFRTDLSVPVLTFETETDLLGLGYFPDQQADSALFRLWEVAGTAHADSYLLSVAATDTGNGAGDIQLFNTMLHPSANAIPGITCDTPVNSGEQHYPLDAAVFALNLWVTHGIAPAHAPRLEINPGPPPSFVLDSHGNVVGGIRTPAVDVPVATLSGLGQNGASFCFLFGTTVPFNSATLSALYPTHQVFARDWINDTINGVLKGFIRPADGLRLAIAGAESTVGG